MLDDGVREILLGGVEPCENRRRLTELGRESKLTRFLQDLPKPAALWCHDDYVAVLVCRIAGRMGLAIPDDIAVLGQDAHRCGASLGGGSGSVRRAQDCGGEARDSSGRPDHGLEDPPSS